MVELWLVTHVLVDSELQWKLFVHPLLPPTAVDTLAMPTEEGRVPIDRNANADSYNLICSQLRAAVEKRASLLSRNVMNELERRLLQRHHSGWFETFLVSVILLNCVERACWLFTSWENEDFVGRVSEPLSSVIFASANSLHSGLWTNAHSIMPTKVTASQRFFICFYECVACHQRQRSTPRLVCSEQ